MGAMWEPEHMQALEAEVGSLAPEVHSEVPGWARLEKHPGGRMLSRPALAGQALPHQTSAAPTDSALSGSGTVASLEISGLSEGSQSGVVGVFAKLLGRAASLLLVRQLG